MQQLSFEKTPCDWCGSNETRLIFTGPDLLLGLPGQFSMVRCASCGLIRQDPRLKWDSLIAYYTEEYGPYEKNIAEEKSRFKQVDRRYGMWKRLRAIQQLKPLGKLLEIGCGTGIFLAEAQRTGRWELTAVEPNVEAAAYVEKNLHVPVFVDRFSEARLPLNNYDVIVMWNVLEHLDHPIGDLRHIHELLKEGGWLIFSIPNVESLDSKMFGPYWLGWELPRHLYLFPRKQMRQILDQIGFTRVRESCLAGNHASFGLSIEFALRGKNLQNRSLARLLLSLYRSLPVRLLFSPLFWLIGKFRRSTLITVFAQKRSLRD
jgi:SAM-dependent methyltransferase